MPHVVVRRSIHGVDVAIDCDARDVAGLAERRLAFFPETERDPEVIIEIATSGAPPHGRVPPAARVVHESPNGFVAYDDTTDELWARYGERGRARCRLAAGRARIDVDRDAPGWEWVATRPLLTLSLLELLKRRSLYGLHAAGAARGTDAVVVAGATGAGKSTTVLALALSGWSFLGDDLLFLDARAPHGVLAFPDEIDATPTTFSLFPALGRPEDWPTLPGYAKHQVPVTELQGGAAVAGAVPRVVLLPHVEPMSGAHRLERVSADEVLMELVPNVLLTAAGDAQAHLELLGRLATTVPGYRLTLGPDLDALSALLDELLVQGAD